MIETITHNIPYERIYIDRFLLLRQLQLEDTEHVYSIVNANREYLGKWLPWVNATKSIQDTRKFISDMIEKRIAGSEYGYAIVVDGVSMGHISLMHLSDGEEPEIGYWIASDASGKGITTKAAGALTDFGFDTLKLTKILIKADPDNLPSNKVAQKLDYKIERIEYGADQTKLVNVWSKTSKTS